MNTNKQRMDGWIDRSVDKWQKDIQMDGYINR